MKPGRFLLRRAVLLPPLLLLVAVFTFLLLRLGGQDPSAAMAGPTASTQEIALLRNQYGLDLALPVQFVIWFGHVVQGDLGRSWLTGKPVVTELLARVPATLELLLFGLLLGCAVGIPLGLYTALHRGRWADQITRILSLFGFSIPTYFLALVMLLLFFATLDWAPPGMGRLNLMLDPPPTHTGSYLIDGLIARDWEVVYSAAAQLVLPVLSVAIVAAAPIIKQVRAVVLDIMGSDHLRFAVAQGLRPNQVARMALRSAAVPIVTFVAGELTGLVGTTSLIEYVFSWSGVGQYGLQAIVRGDFSRCAGLRSAVGPVLRRGVPAGGCRGAGDRTAGPRMSGAAALDVPRFPAMARVRGLVRRSPVAAVGLLILAIFAAVAVFHGALMPYDPLAADAAHTLATPSAAHPFGTDSNGMDVLSRTLYGTVYAFGIAVPAVMIAVLLGVPVGLVTGYAGGWLDESVMRVFDALRVFPSIILALAVVSAAGASLVNVVLVIGVLDAPIFARIVRAEVLALRGGSFMECAVAAGNPVWRLLFVHLMPNALQGTVAQVTVRAAWAVRISATLAFLGVGIQPPTPEWGAMIRQGTEYMVTGQWWIGVFPGLALILMIFGLNLSGDGVADLLDPARTEPGLMLLRVRELETHFVTRDRYDRIRAARTLNGVSFDLAEGRILGLVGESGAGKSLTVTSILGLLRAPAKVVGGTALFEGADLLRLTPAQRQRVLGSRIGLVVQSPRTSLDPLATVGEQLLRVQRTHARRSRRDAAARAEAMLAAMGIPDPARRMRSWPHELSGGMAQRVVIALALVNEPQLLVADEPTTGLDVTVQAQILDLLAEAVRVRRIGAIVITHDLGVVAQYCDDVAVMFAGQVMEHGPVATVFADPAHPYTRALLEATPERLQLGRKRDDGAPPDLANLPGGCLYRERCRQAEALCHQPPPLAVDGSHAARCHFAALQRVAA